VHSSQDNDIIQSVHQEKEQSVHQEGGTIFKAEIRTGRIVPAGMIPEADYYVFIVVV
jgi:hypothetical protein